MISISSTLVTLGTLVHFSLPAIAISEQLFLVVHLALLGHTPILYANRRRRGTFMSSSLLSHRQAGFFASSLFLEKGPTP
jgi:hypothetical protein